VNEWAKPLLVASVFIRLRCGKLARIHLFTASGGIAACSRWLSAVCETTGNKGSLRTPDGVPAASRYACKQGLEPHPGFERLYCFPVVSQNCAQPPATCGDPFSGIKERISSQVFRDPYGAFVIIARGLQRPRNASPDGAERGLDKVLAASPQRKSKGLKRKALGDRAGTPHFEPAVFFSNRISGIGPQRGELGSSF
jgi:hypothetical protein